MSTLFVQKRRHWRSKYLQCWKTKTFFSIINPVLNFLELLYILTYFLSLPKALIMPCPFLLHTYRMFKEFLQWKFKLWMWTYCFSIQSLYDWLDGPMRELKFSQLMWASCWGDSCPWSSEMCLSYSALCRATASSLSPPPHSALSSLDIICATDSTKKKQKCQPRKVSMGW